MTDQIDEAYPIINVGQITPSTLIPITGPNQPFGAFVQATTFLGGGSGGNAEIATTVATFIATSYGPAVTQVNILGYYTIGIGALSVRRTISEPAHPWKFQTADGGWWEGYTTTGIIYPSQFGTVPYRRFGDTSHDDTTAIQNCFAYQDYMQDYATRNDITTVRFENGFYTCTSTIAIGIAKQIRIDTLTPPSEGTTSCVIQFPPGVPGMTVGHGTLFYMEGIGLNGGSPDLVTNYPVANGFQVSTIHIVKNCFFFNFTGHGYASLGYGGANGVTDESLVEKCNAYWNGGHGFYIAGSDANACTYLQCSGNYNNRAGFCDDSFLGNTFIACHTNGNGNPALVLQWLNKTAGWGVSHGGNSYLANPHVYYETQPNYGAVTPGTDETVWLTQAVGAVYYPAFVPGANYMPSASMMALDQNSSTVWINCYAEDGQGPAWIKAGRAEGFGIGLMGGGAGFIPQRPAHRCGLLQARYVATAGTGKDNITVELCQADTVIQKVTLDSGNWFTQKDLTKGTIDWCPVLSSPTYSFGMQASAPWGYGYAFHAYDGFLVGGSSAYNSATWLRCQHVSNAIPPASGTVATNQIALVKDNALGLPVGWRCIHAGTAGVDAIFEPITTNTLAASQIANTATTNTTLIYWEISGATFAAGAPTRTVLPQTYLFMNGTLGGDSNAQLPLVSDFIANAPNTIAGQTWNLRIINASSVNHVWTITTNTGWTLSGTMTIAQNTYRDFLVEMTSLTAMKLTNVGSGTL